ncbi:MAG: CPBP family intramembrane metalloprotease [Lachnospiraceae bacterium]|nr:CPBP family intramembrane metalloprotease [Lachnospiraceae bacterium]
MKKLYEKSEITFAILWIVIYTVGMGILQNQFGLDSLWHMLGLAVISAAMFLFVKRNGLTEKYGLAGWAKNSKAMLWFIPLWILSCLNLLSGFRPDYPVPGLIWAAVSMALVGFAEELLFRGFLFKAMLKDGNVKAAVIVSSVTFGLGHIMNLFTGQDLVETLNQVVFAVAVGFVFTFVFYKSGSLLPGILAHSFIDVSSVFAADEGSKLLNLILHIGIIVLSAAYCFYLAKCVEAPAVNRTDGQKKGTPDPREC